MTQADRVHSTPPTNTSANTPLSSRRRFLVQAAGVAAGGATLGMALPLPAPAATPDPIFAVIEKHKALTVPFDAAWKARGSFNDTGDYDQQSLKKLNDAIDAAGLPMEAAACDLLDTVPTTPAGIAAAMRQQDPATPNSLPSLIG
jgi:hypothetical protein